MIKVYFDLDGTLFNLYGKIDWLETLRSEKEGAFKVGDLLNDGFMPEIDLVEFYDKIDTLRSKGVTFGVITWLPMEATKEYEVVCTKEKEEWIKEYLPFVESVSIVPYGTPKHSLCGKAKRVVLIDDNKKVCKDWRTKKQRIALQVTKKTTVIECLDNIAKMIRCE